MESRYYGPIETVSMGSATALLNFKFQPILRFDLSDMTSKDEISPKYIKISKIYGIHQALYRT